MPVDDEVDVGDVRLPAGSGTIQAPAPGCHGSRLDHRAVGEPGGRCSDARRARRRSPPPSPGRPSTSLNDTEPTSPPSGASAAAHVPDELVAGAARRPPARAPRRRRGRARGGRPGDPPAPPAAGAWPEPREDPLVEAEGRLDGRHRRQHSLDRRPRPRRSRAGRPCRSAGARPCRRAAGPSTWPSASAVCSSSSCRVRPPLARRQSPRASSSSREAPLLRWPAAGADPVLILVLAVPSGTPSRRPTSSAVQPANTASTTDRACSGGSARRRAIARPASMWSWRRPWRRRCRRRRAWRGAGGRARRRRPARTAGRARRRSPRCA